MLEGGEAAVRAAITPAFQVQAPSKVTMRAFEGACTWKVQVLWFSRVLRI